MSSSNSTDLLAQAEAYCIRHKHRLTAPRWTVFKIIAGSHQPLGAYEILTRLGQIFPDPKPPTVYRAIAFWQKHGFIHRIESQNAYIACAADHPHKSTQFLICDECSQVIESHLCNPPDTLQKTMADQHFQPTSWHLEIRGLCTACSTSKESHS